MGGNFSRSLGEVVHCAQKVLLFLYSLFIDLLVDWHWGLNLGPPEELDKDSTTGLYILKPKLSPHPPPFFNFKDLFLFLIMCV